MYNKWNIHYCLDLGGSTIDMVEFFFDNFQVEKLIISELKSLESKKFPQKKIEEVLKAFGIIERVIYQKILYITGGHSQKLPEKIVLGTAEIFLKKISEFKAIAKGGMFLSKENSGLVVSLGTGTAMVSVRDIKKNDWEHVRGTGIGGGTFLGLGHAILGVSDFYELQKISKNGNVKNVDISVGEILGGGLGKLTPEMTASNFGKFSPKTSQKSDIALAIANLVGQSIASLAVEKAKVYNHKKIILGGKFSRFSVIVECIKKTAEIFDMEIIVPKHSSFMTAVGATLG